MSEEEGASTEVALLWLPSWFLVAEGDQTIPPDAERQFAARMGATTTEGATNHVAMVSHLKRS